MKKAKAKIDPTWKKVAGYINYWQPKLRLVDWDISHEITQDSEDGFAHVKHWPNDQRAHMTVLEPSRIPPDWQGVRDLEVTVVHELLHTRFLYMTPIKAFRNNCHEEMAIETCARVMVSLRRGISPEELN